MKIFCVAVLFSVVLMTRAVMYKDCGSATCVLNSVDVSGCAADAQTCNFVRGQTANMTLKFTTKSDVNNLKNNVQGLVGGTWVPFQNKDACPTITPACPVPSGTDATFTISIVVSKLYPQIGLIIEDKMTDSTGAVCTCFELQAKIV
ncbi:NPC intracellular cholesterol transporter 2 homolog a-like [Dysidea avara]|uniref:NPC intracellular cholesterol transporter 2 homolog a-like n=1 Tax=Dysidea avara TaxID=196820 RepID=UPI00332DA08C